MKKKIMKTLIRIYFININIYLSTKKESNKGLCGKEGGYIRNELDTSLDT